MRKVAVFDFDGTLTTKDTLLEFIRFACGSWQLYIGLCLYSPVLVLMTLRLFPNWKAKQMVFSWFFKGMDYARFAELGRMFAAKVVMMKRESMHEQLSRLKADGANIYVVSASIEEWVRPYCERLGVKDVLATRIEVADGKLTGRFLSKNCYGQEKVTRLLEVESDRNEYCLYAFGDSRGDKEMLAFADKGHLVE